MDEGYQGPITIFRSMKPTKRTKDGDLSRDTVAEKRKVVSDRNMRENFFGRLFLLRNAKKSNRNE